MVKGKKKKEERTLRMKLGITLGQESLARLKELELSYIRQGKRIRQSGIVEEAIQKLWQEVCKK